MNLQCAPHSYFCSKRKGSSNCDEDTDENNASGEEYYSKRNRLDENSSLKSRGSPRYNGNTDDVISGESDEDDVFAPIAKPSPHNPFNTSVMDKKRPFQLSATSTAENTRLHEHRSIYHHLPSTSPSSMDQHLPMMRRLELEARQGSVGGSMASTSSTSSSVSPKSCTVPPVQQVTPPLPHYLNPHNTSQPIVSPSYLPPTPPSAHYIPTSPFYHQYQQMLAAQRYQMLSQYAAAAAAASLPPPHPPFYSSVASHFGLPHPPLNSSFGLSTTTTTPVTSQLSFASTPNLNVSPSLDRISTRSASPPRPSKADSTTAAILPTNEMSNNPIQLSPSKLNALHGNKYISNGDIEATAPPRHFSRP